MANNMLKLFGVGSKKKPPAGSPSADPISSQLPSGLTLQHTDVQRELVRVVLKDTLRKNGIPAGWIGCEVTGISHSNMDDEMFVHLIIMQWNEALLHFAPALQQQLMQGLDRFEPNVDHSNYVVSWLYSPDCECPFTDMPQPTFWAMDEQAQHEALLRARNGQSFDAPPPSTAVPIRSFAPTVPSNLP